MSHWTTEFICERAESLRYTTQTCRTTQPIIEPIQDQFNNGRLTNEVHTTPYNSNRRKNETFNKCCRQCSSAMDECWDNCKAITIWFIPLLIMVLACGALVYVAVYMAIETAESAEYEDSLTIHGECELLNVTEVQGTYNAVVDSTRVTYGYYYLYEWEVVNLTECTQIGYDQFEEKKQYILYEVGDIDVCWTNEGCQGIHIITKETISEHEGQSIAVVVIALLLAIACLGCSVAYTKNIKPPQEVENAIKCHDIQCRLCCDYLIGIDKQKHKYNQVETLGNGEIFDYYMSYYGRKYHTNLGNNVYDLIWCMLYG